MQTIEEELPIELECWLIRHGIVKAEPQSGHAPIYMIEEEPSYEGEEPPF